MRAIKSYGFGYDIDNVKEVQQHVVDNYKPDYYNIHIARGDDVMNHMTIYRSVDTQLDELIECCDGAGDFEEWVAHLNKTSYNYIMDEINNIWEQMETHMKNRLGIYGLEMMDQFLDLKEQAEDRGMCDPDTHERQTQLEQQHG